MKKLRGFSLLEVIYCCAIIAIVAAILTPVFRSAKHAAQVTASISNLHQMSVALNLYQTAQGATAQYGTLEQMGMPSGITAYDSLNLPAEVWRTPCGLNPSWFGGGPITKQYEYFAMTSISNWEDAVNKYHDNAVTFIDMNCAEHGEPLASDFFPHQGLGVRLSGELLNLHKPGDYKFQSWWN